ncbi:hypothetical protein HPB51_023593 [Rhipicephalus microplus]|uniref:Uncharacterized protein n=1 Tax=Rhipicephalus microplus TaxID=6941 RepID=A0A9J6DCX1_RHIMP|nr:hypothetical protein HPB51_023593 [Rhipicephalus microplus]
MYGDDITDGTLKEAALLAANSADKTAADAIVDDIKRLGYGILNDFVAQGGRSFRPSGIRDMVRGVAVVQKTHPFQAFLRPTAASMQSWWEATVGPTDDSCSLVIRAHCGENREDVVRRESWLDSPSLCLPNSRELWLANVCRAACSGSPGALQDVRYLVGVWPSCDNFSACKRFEGVAGVRRSGVLLHVRVDVRPPLVGALRPPGRARVGPALACPAPVRAMFVNVSGCAVPLGLATSALRSCGIGSCALPPASPPDIVPLLQVPPARGRRCAWADLQ